MIQLEQMYLSGFIQRHRGCHARNSESGVRSVDDISKGYRLDFARGNVETKNLEGELREAHMRPIILPVWRQGGNVFWKK